MEDCEAFKLQHLIAFQNVYALIFEDHQMLTTTIFFFFFLGESIARQFGPFI